MFDLGMGELLLIGIVALIVVGPKDLPGMFRTVGQFVGRARGMAREFSRAMEQAADDSGVKDIQKTLRAATDPVGTAVSSVKATVKDATSALTDLDPDSETAKLAAEREAKRKQMQADTTRKRAERLEREAAEARLAAETAEAALATPLTGPTDPA